MYRNRKGETIAAASTVLSLFVPLILVVLLSTIECAIAYVVHENLTGAALQAAHDLGVVWSLQNQPGQPLTSEQQQAVYNEISVPYIIPENTSGGTNPNFSAATFDFTNTPNTVTVTSKFVPAANLVKVVNISGWLMQFNQISSIQIKSSVTYPLPSRNLR